MGNSISPPWVAAQGGGHEFIMFTMNFYDDYNHWTSRFSSSRLWEKSKDAKKGKVYSCWLTKWMTDYP